MRRALITAVLGPALLLTGPAVARAGLVQIHTCQANGTTVENRSWGLEAAPPPAGIGADGGCPAGGAIGLRVPSGARTADGAAAGFTFTAPPGSAVVDFRLERRLHYVPAHPEDTHAYYVLYTLGETPFAGAGDYDAATRDRLSRGGHWYGHPDRRADLPRGTVTRATFPALAGAPGDARTLSLRVGCFRRGTPCAMNPDARINHVIFGATVTVDDRTAPAELVVEASGLLAGGPRSGRDPVRIARAADNLGIRRAEILDVTDPAAPRVVGAEDYDTAASGTTTDAGTGCAFRLARPCPDLDGETLTATALPAGRRLVAVRVTDPGGLARQSETFAVDVASPSDRGAANGSGATEGGRLSAAFSRGGARRTARYGEGLVVRGRLLNEAGGPVAGAVLQVQSRDADRDAFADRGTVRTEADGSFAYRPTARVNRAYQFGWRSRANDPQFAATAEVAVRVRAAATLSARPRTVRLRRAVRLTGRLLGRRTRGVDVVLQGRAVGEKRYRTFDETRTGSEGRFRATLRLLRPSSRGRRFRIRAKILPTGRYPYLRGYSRRVTVRVR